MYGLSLMLIVAPFFSFIVT